MQKTFVIRSKEIADRACAYIQGLVGASPPMAVLIVPSDRRRTLEQNDKLHAMFRELSDIAWMNGRQGSPEDWKAWLLLRLGYAETYIDLTTGELKAIPASTSQMSVRQLSELIERIQHFAAEELGVEL